MGHLSLRADGSNRPSRFLPMKPNISHYQIARKTSGFVNCFGNLGGLNDVKLLFMKIVWERLSREIQISGQNMLTFATTSSDIWFNAPNALNHMSDEVVFGALNHISDEVVTIAIGKMSNKPDACRYNNYGASRNGIQSPEGKIHD